jgi:hypothetical protein
MVEFQCLDCGQRVYRYADQAVEPRCASCCWIRENVPPEYQADARERLGVPLVPDPLTIYFRPCRVCGALIGCLENDMTPICQDCDDLAGV